MNEIFTLKWRKNTLVLLDQTKIPREVAYVECKTVQDIYDAIQTMIVRGAPAIGVSAAYGMVIAANTYDGKSSSDKEKFMDYLRECAEYLKSSRPTAVNLMWAVDRIMDKVEEMQIASIEAIKAEMEKDAIAIHKEDENTNRTIGLNLLSLLKDGDTVLTHCNAGSLAASAYGTALAVFYIAQEKGMNIKAYADETRPRLQGANLTAFELAEHGVDVTLICDNMAAVVMSQGKIDAVIVGCDRVAANGDTANKIGTYSVSLLADHFQIPVYIAAPTTTIDMDCRDGSAIPIEERSADEVLCVNGGYIAPKEVKTYNPAFDVTPAEYITAIVTEKGIVYPPFIENLEKIMRK
ncbi:MAG: S-methyl-5-thioribose-1-phosphate isomerase [Ruminococcus sp.]|nr:S-methyl-5-thioribose-1-phosphate isomerase [Ruminococcus sp.]